MFPNKTDCSITRIADFLLFGLAGAFFSVIIIKPVIYEHALAGGLIWTQTIEKILKKNIIKSDKDENINEQELTSQL